MRTSRWSRTRRRAGALGAYAAIFSMLGGVGAIISDDDDDDAFEEGADGTTAETEDVGFLSLFGNMPMTITVRPRGSSQLSARITCPLLLH